MLWINFNSCFVRFLGCLCNHILILSDLHIPLHSPTFILITRTFIIMLNRSSENFFLVPNLKEKQLQISLSVLIMMLATGVLMAFINLRKFFTIPTLLIVFIINVF